MSDEEIEHVLRSLAAFADQTTQAMTSMREMIMIMADQLVLAGVFDANYEPIPGAER